MKLSYWEYKTWFSNVDFTIVGSGIVGLNCALSLREAYPHARILLLEKGFLPQGASTKNAGFACFGSLSEILTDLKNHSREEVVELVRMRWEGIALLRKMLGDKAIGFEAIGGNELFLKDDTDRYESCLQEMNAINELLQPVFETAAFKTVPNTFGFAGIKEHLITNELEGSLDTGRMMESLLKAARKKDITILNSFAVDSFEQKGKGVEIRTADYSFYTGKLFIATNGFASEILDISVRPARAQVLVTKPIPDLNIRGTFHMEEGYYYFRNVEDRILLGGARNLDFEGETTTKFGLNNPIQDHLDKILKEVILVDKSFEIDRRWSGIMGVGIQKRPIVKQLSDDVFCGVRLGGMGIAIGSIVGKSLAGLLQ